MSGDVGSIAGGYDTTHMSAAEADRLARAERQADAVAWLTARDLGDIAVILGLMPERCASCGGEATRMGYCDDKTCQAALRRSARKVSDATYRKARKAVGTG